MVPQNNKRSNTHSDDETLNPTPYKRIKPAEAPSIAPDLDASPKYKHLLAILMLIAMVVTSVTLKHRPRRRRG